MLIWGNTNWICSPPKFFLNWNSDWRNQMILELFWHSSSILQEFFWHMFPWQNFDQRSWWIPNYLRSAHTFQFYFTAVCLCCFWTFLVEIFSEKYLDGSGILHNFLLEYWLGFLILLNIWTRFFWLRSLCESRSRASRK